MKMINFQNEMAVKVTKKVKYATALYHKINATRSTFYMESFMLFSKSAHLVDYAALLYHYHGFIFFAHWKLQIPMQGVTSCVLILDYI